MISHRFQSYLCFALPLALILPIAAIADNLTLHVGTLIAVPGDAPLSERTVVIEDDRIVAVEPGFLPAAADSQLLDLRDAWVVPGLMDMHVHLLIELGPEAKLRQLTESDELTLMRGVANARTTVEAGFTTVRDLGARPKSIFALRDAINAGLVPGPRIFAAGSAIAATGGHGDTHGVRPELMEMWTPNSICDGVDDCRRATREAIKYGADWIKITATGGVLSDTGTGLGVQMTDEELAEIVRTAHTLGVKVAAHAHGTDGIDAALRAGVDSIDHGTFTRPSSVELFLEHDSWLVPTLLPGASVAQTMEGNPFFTPAIRDKVREASNASREGFALALEAGVNIAFGTDSGVTPHGRNADEFALMVEFGMTPAEALRAATVMTARLLGVDDELGTIEVGKLADLVVVDADPLADIRALESVRAVVADGRVVKGR
jgi:imidazolonepropionase-like amidohydrolase